MKKLSINPGCFLALFFMFMLMAGCGGGGGGGNGASANANDSTSAANSGSTDSGTAPTTPPDTTPPGTTDPGATTTPPVIQPTIKTNGFAPISDSEYVENIVWAVNESFALEHPEWQANTQKVIDDFNALFARSRFINDSGAVEYVKKRYVINGKFKTYPDNDLENASKDPAYYFDNGYAGKIKGTTFFTFVYSDYSQIPNVSMRAGMRAGGAGGVAIDGKQYMQVFAAEPINMNVLIGKAAVTQNTGSAGNFERCEYLYFHEAGHTEGLFEGYNYIYADKSGALPTLDSYNRQTLFPNDPMSMAPHGKSDLPAPVYVYSPFNAKLIQQNANHQYDLWEITQGVPDWTWIKVVDGQNLPVSGAQVKIYGAAKNDMVTDNSNQVDMTVELGTFVSGSDGYVKLDTSKYLWNTYTNNAYIAWGIKASLNGKYAGRDLRLDDDLETAFLDKGLNTLEIILRLQ